MLLVFLNWQRNKKLREKLSRSQVTLNIVAMYSYYIKYNLRPSNSQSIITISQRIFDSIKKKSARTFYSV